MDILIRSEIPAAAAVGGKTFTNSFAFHGVSDLLDSTLSGYCDAVQHFYMQQAPGALAAMKEFFSPEIDNDTDRWWMKVYDLTGNLGGGSLGSPVFEDAYSFQGSTADLAGLPAEVAVCLTLESVTRASEPVETADGGDAGSERDRPMQRHTGRIYLGPLNVSTLTTDSQTVRPNENILDTVRLAAAELQDEVNGLGGQWAIWSRKDANLRTVGFVSVDNAFDTVRLRGAEPTTRQRALMP